MVLVPAALLPQYMARSTITILPAVLQVTITAALPDIPLSAMENVLRELAVTASSNVTLPVPLGVTVFELMWSIGGSCQGSGAMFDFPCLE